ncbi:VOC family protein [Haladaptatus sp. CMAA 1911]|uniref:VOC family protein n=1 Tax=unclassified Haladaptatus TaxID=2622732 RepID=UPI0037540C45
MTQESTGHVSRVTHFALIVGDQEKALGFYTETLGFEKKEDSEMGEDRWLTVAPAGREGVHIILRSPDWFDGRDADRYERVVGHNPMIGLEVDDCHATYKELHARGVEFASEPQEREYGVEVIALDPEGNELLFVEPARN